MRFSKPFLFGPVGGARHGCLADGHHLPQQALVLDDADVLFDVELVRQALSEREKVGLLADGVQLLAAIELLNHGDKVDGAAQLDQAGNDGVDAAVGVE